jgi:vacuolar-type H+-ATPase subunit I/STV1
MLSESLYRLAERAKLAEQKAEQAQKQAAGDARAARAELEKSVDDAGASAEAQARKLRENAKASQDKVSRWWEEQQEAWNEHLDKARQGIEQKKGKLDAKMAAKRAEDAEADADFAVDFAYGAIEEAEYSVLDAILARAEADDIRTT